MAKKENKSHLDPQIKSLEDKILKKQRDIFNQLSPWDRTLLARHPQRPYFLDYISGIFNDFIELKGDRCYGDDPAIVGGFAKLEKQKVMLIGHQKGREVQERTKRNFGMAHPEGYRKALRLMKLAEKVSIPIITFIDTPGAFPGVASEERHVGEAIACNLRECFSIKSPIISIIIGEGGSGGALGIGIADFVLMMRNSYYSVISPEGCASILWKDSSKAAKAAEQLKISSEDLLECKIIDFVVEEPLGGAHTNIPETFVSVKKGLEKYLKILQEENRENILSNRYKRFRKFGVFSEE